MMGHFLVWPRACVHCWFEDWMEVAFFWLARGACALLCLCGRVGTATVGIAGFVCSLHRIVICLCMHVCQVGL